MSVCEQHCGLSGQGDGKEKSGLVCSAWKSEAEIKGGFSHQEGLLSSVASLHLILTFRECLAEIVSEERFCLRSWAGVCHPLREETPSQHGAWGGGSRRMLSISWLSRQPWLGEYPAAAAGLCTPRLPIQALSPMARLWLSRLASAKCVVYWPGQHFAVPEQ